ncbi:hypothetical protein [Micromonospora arborensis]|uniref:hypothetical protein n=1 Tax=Micromonospora arborensis TaxID=2116518 RepID=UPI003723382A
MTRFKWFVPWGDAQAYDPFGIICASAVPLYGHRGGWTLAGATGPDQPTAQEAAASNRAFWDDIGRAAPARPEGRRPGDERPPA